MSQCCDGSCWCAVHTVSAGCNYRHHSGQQILSAGSAWVRWWAPPPGSKRARRIRFPTHDSRRKTAPRSGKKRSNPPPWFVWGLFTSDEFWPFSFLRASADLVAKMLRAVLLVVAAASASAFAPAAVLPRAAQSECPATCTSSPKHWICAEADWTRLQRRSSGRAGAAASRMGACGCML